MSFTLPPLPFPVDALEPHISATTIGYHYGKHHAGYLARTNELLARSDSDDQVLESLIRAAYEQGDIALFNAAAQTWNHSFYWNSLHPKGGGQPRGTIATLIEKDFGEASFFLEQLEAAANGVFGSGWTWVVLDDGRLDIVSTSNAESPLVRDQVPLLVIDIWEHAYYLDHQNRRADYVRAVLHHLINWEFANENLEAVSHLVLTDAASLNTAENTAYMASPD